MWSHECFTNLLLQTRNMSQISLWYSEWTNGTCGNTQTTTLVKFVGRNNTTFHLLCQRYQLFWIKDIHTAPERDRCRYRDQLKWLAYDCIRVAHCTKTLSPLPLATFSHFISLSLGISLCVGSVHTTLRQTERLNEYRENSQLEKRGFGSLHNVTWTCYLNEDILLRHWLRFTNEVD